jgi:hypothetical protein
MAIGGPSGNQPFAKIVLQNVEVLAVAQQIENTNSDKPQIVRVVTLLVSPADAERLTLASHEGALRLAMRNFADQTIVATAGTQAEQILRPDEAMMAAATTPVQRHAATPGHARELPVEIEIMRNGKTVENVAFVHRGVPARQKANATPAENAPSIPGDAAPTKNNNDAAPAAATESARFANPA